MFLFQVRLVILFVSSLPSSPIDFIFPTQGRCTRENCKYLHPPAHLKTQLEINGRNNLIQQKTAAAMLAQQMQFMIPSTTMQPVVSVRLCITVEIAVLHCKIFEFFKFLPATDIWDFHMLFIVARLHSQATLPVIFVFFELSLGKEFQILCGSCGSFTAGNGSAVVILVRCQMWWMQRCV